MAAYKAYIIVFKTGGSDNRDNIKNTIKTLGAWMGYFNDFYLIHTTLDYPTIKERLDKAIVQGSDRILIAEVNINAIKGWLPPNAWDWLKKQRGLSK